MGLKQRRELSKRSLGWSLAWWRSTEKKEASDLLGLRGRHQYSDQRSLCGLHHSRDQGGGGPNGQIVSVKRAAGRRTQRTRKIIDEKREKYRAKNLPMWNTSKGATVVIFEKPCKHTCQKGKIESNEQSKEVGQPK